MPYKTFARWLFDGNLNSQIPDREVLLKYNSPITQTYLLGIMVRNAKLNHYLDNHLNNLGIRYLDKEELFYFIKKCVHDFKIQKNSLHFLGYPKRKSQLFDKIKSKLPTLKNDDIALLCEMVDESDDKDIIYSSMGIDKVEKEKIKVKKTGKQKKNDSIMSLSYYLDKYFKVVKI
jgi:hypothetical protein